MFTYKRHIHLRDTDATGFLYFSELFTLAIEAVECYFFSKGITLQEMIEKGEFLMPVVHAEADFISPLKVGDLAEIHLSIKNIGTSSFTTHVDIFKKGKKVATTKVVHVAISKEKEKSLPIPKLILDQLSHLCLTQGSC